MIMKLLQQQPWLESKKKDLLFILLPAFIPLLLIITFQDYFSHQTEVNIFWWIVLVLSIDVAHVYSTLFRFYWEKDTYAKHKVLLTIIPLAAFTIGFILHLIDAMLFWRVIAYVAVFHFVRQQYGFMRLYSRKEKLNRITRFIDSLTIYSATLYPLLYWHANLTSNLHWFVEGDFIHISTNITSIAFYIYWIIIVIYLIKEIIIARQTGNINLPKNLLIIGTCLSWYLGIITFKGDLIFTLFNVIAHGIPYMALVYFFSSKKSPQNSKLPWKRIAIFIITILGLAYLEEGLWDGLVWKDHETIFPFFNTLPAIESPLLLAVLVPLLALPQLTHYVLDGFIWKMNSSHAKPNGIASDLS